MDQARGWATERWVRYNYCDLRLDEAGRRAGTAARRIGIGKPAGWCEDGEVEETAGVIGSCLQLYGAPIRVSGSDESERA